MGEFANEDSLREVFKLLTGKDGNFDEEKQKIINCTDSAHIQACPGSGKTTTLLAKLVLLAEQMPLKNGKGICVLTYTNVAIDEIKSKLGHKADILFSYPNFFGTIQTFVDEFFASAALHYYYGSRISLVDNEKTNDELLKTYRAKGYCQLDKFLYGHNYSSRSILTQEEIDSCGGIDYLLNIKAIKKDGKKNRYQFLWKKKEVLNHKTSLPSEIIPKLLNIASRISHSLDKKNAEDYVKFIASSKVDFVNDHLITDIHNFNTFQSQTAQEFIEVKKQQLLKGNLKFFDSFNLALRLMSEFPEIKNELSERFEYLFVDEMQDTGKTEMSFLESALDGSKIRIQYFGDLDQSIFQDGTDDECLWKPQNALLIQTSKRFGEEIAKIINPFRLNSSKTIKGNDNVASLKPVMLVYDNPLSVLPAFVDLLEKNKIVVDGETYSIKDYSLKLRREDSLHRINVKAIGWSGTDIKEGKIKIQSYFPEYYRKQNSLEAQACLLEDILAKKVNRYQDAIKIMFEAFLEFMRFAHIKGKDNRYFTKSSLLQELELYEGVVDDFKKLLSICASYLMEKNLSGCIGIIKKYLERDFLKVFSYDRKFVAEFCKSKVIPESLEQNEYSNIYSSSDLDIEVGTVHSVKGETHVATLYMETFFRTGHEGKLLWNQFKGLPYEKRSKDSVVRKALKIAYVAMSRPRYFLCVAISKEHYQESNEIRERWNVINV